MSLTVFNGSPRGKISNSSIITDWFLGGYQKENTIYFLNKSSKTDAHIKAFVDAEEVLMVFPLYVDGMPGQVKAFFEYLIPFKDKITNKKITFIIHSGFQEGIQNRALEEYLNRFSDLFRLDNYGVIIIPGSEGFRLMPPFILKKKVSLVKELGLSFLEGRPFSKIYLTKLISREKMGGFSKFTFKLGKIFGLTNLYWDSNLKKNHVFDKRFDAPYENKPVAIKTDAYLRNDYSVKKSL